MANNSAQLPYLACLIQNLPVKTQLQLRDFTNYGVRPLGMLLALMGFVCNALVVLTVTRTKSLQHPSLLMLCSLSVTDLIYSSYSLYRNVDELAREGMCVDSVGADKYSMSAFCLLSTVANLAIISQDRYLAIRKPWWYRNNATKSRAIAKICVAWFISIVITLFIYFRSKVPLEYIPQGYHVSMLFYCICLLVIVVSYIGIFLKKNQSTDARLLAAIKREKKLTNSVGLILLVMFLTFLPALVSPLAFLMAGIRFRPYRSFYTFFLQLNALLNPLLNFGRNKNMRAGLKRLLTGPRRIQPHAGTFDQNRNQLLSVSENISLERVSQTT